MTRPAKSAPSRRARALAFLTRVWTRWLRLAPVALWTGQPLCARDNRSPPAVRKDQAGGGCLAAPGAQRLQTAGVMSASADSARSWSGEGQILSASDAR